MEGYFIDALQQKITPFKYQYSDISKRLGGSMCLGCIFPNGDPLFVSDDGMLKLADRAFRLRSRPNDPPLLSDGVLTGRDNHDPDAKIGTLPPKFTVRELAREVQWLTVAEALDWFRARVGEAAVTRRDGNGEVTVIARWGDLLKNLEGKPGGYSPDQVFL